MVERFSINFPMGRTYFDANGPLVRHSDYEALEAENAELRAKLDMQRESKEYAQRCCIAAETRLGEATTCAEKLAVTLHQKHYLADAREWRVLSGDLVGVLTQIDNMTSGLVRAEAAMELAGKLNAAEATIARLSEALTECALLSGLDNELIEGASVIVTSRMAEIHQHASAALAGSGGGRPVPDGWKLVPVEPTEAMVCAVDHDDCATPDSAARAYKAMLTAAQEGR